MMRKPIHSVWYGVSILFIMLNVVSCKKNAADPNDAQESYTIGFKFQEFEQHISPLGTRTKMAKQGAINRSFADNAHENTYEGPIYYWSFNAETLMPDVYSDTYWSITYNDGQTPDDYAIGWAYEDYVAGSALSLRGLEELIFYMPLTNVFEVQELAFDVSSSGTGPKSFSLAFSQDGENYTIIEEDNQFPNTNTAQARNTFVFALDELSLDLSVDLYIKLVPKAGERGNAGEYNAVTGVMRMDNFRLLGVAEQVAQASVRRIHYHIFDAVTQNLVLSGADHFREGALADFALTLPAGDYIASFVTNVSNAELTIPETGDASTYFMANTFANHHAHIFGVLDTFSVTADVQRDIELSRYYSEVRLEFTDREDLSEVAKLVIKRRHEADFYAPFNPAMDNPVEDASEIILYPPFGEDDHDVFFNQFIGNIPEATPLKYIVEVYNTSEELIRTFELESEIRNNMQLLFRGNLLDVPNGQFIVRLNENWDDGKEVNF